MCRNCILVFFVLFYLNLSPYSKLLAQYVYCRAVADILPPYFTKKRNVEKSSITVLVSNVFLISDLPDSLREDKVGDITSHFLTFWDLNSTNFQY